MAYIYENRNPFNKRVGDCVIRAISKVMNMSWTDVAIDLSMMMVTEGDIVSSNALWGEIPFAERIQKRNTSRYLSSLLYT